MSICILEKGQKKPYKILTIDTGDKIRDRKGESLLVKRKYFMMDETI